jgi:hypothetical protein
VAAGRFRNAIPSATSVRKPAVVLALLVMASTAARAWAGRQVPVPWIAPDEMIYGLLGHSLYSSGSLSILGGPTPFYSLVVPAFVGWPLNLGDLAFGYDLLKVLQAAAMSLAALPVYLWGRSFLSPRLALLPAALTLLLPALVYSGLLMSEVLFYPIFVVAAWAMARALERPSLFRQAVLVGAIVLAVLTRLQAFVLLPGLATAVGLESLLARSARPFRSLAPSFGILGLLAAAWIGWRLGSSDSVLGGYSVIAHDPYSVGRAARFVVYHAATLAILSGVFPLCALLLLLTGAVGRGETDPRTRSFLAVAGSLSAWLVVEVGVFASRYVGQLAERDLIGLAPLLFLAFALWLKRGAERRYWATSIVALAVAASLVVLPLDRLVTATAPADAPTIVPLWQFVEQFSRGTFDLVFYVASAAVLVAFALVPRRAIAVLPIVLVLALAGASVAASRYAADQASLRRQTLLGDQPRWIDRGIDGKAAYLFVPGADWTGAWQTIFWNRRIDDVYDLGDAQLFGPIPQRRLVIQPDGALTVSDKGSPAPFLVAPLGSVPSAPSFAFAGEIVATNRRPDTSLGDFAVWKLAMPPRLASRATGLKPNGDIYPGPGARLVAYGCPRGVFRLTLLVKQPQTITVFRNGTVYAHVRFDSPSANEPWRAAIPTVPRPGARRGSSSCFVAVQTDGLLGTTVFQLEPDG